MAARRMRHMQLFHFLLGLLFLTFVVYSTLSPVARYVERHLVGQIHSQQPSHDQPAVLAPINVKGVDLNSLRQGSSIDPTTASTMSMKVFSDSEDSVLYHDSSSSKQSKGSQNGAKELPPIGATSGKELWKQQELKGGSQSASAVIHHNTTSSYATPLLSGVTVNGVLVSSLYESGHDITATQMCQDAGSGMQLLILVTSAPRHTEARMAIRQTWGHFGVRRDMSVGFLVASSKDSESQHLLEGESALYADIIRAKFVDSYVNLTLKTISMFEWVDTYCPRVRFILKTDDDMFINVPRLLSFIRKHSGDKRTIYGRLAQKWRPNRNKKSKYYVSLQHYPAASYPNFTTGPAYLLTGDTIHDLYATSLSKKYLHLEDVFATGIVAEDLKVKRVHVDEFMNMRVSFHPCNILNGISIHMVKYPEQFHLWKILMDGRSNCD